VGAGGKFKGLQSSSDIRFTAVSHIICRLGTQPIYSLEGVIIVQHTRERETHTHSGSERRSAIERKS
jgi:hypothetical protein